MTVNNLRRSTARDCSRAAVSFLLLVGAAFLGRRRLHANGQHATFPLAIFPHIHSRPEGRNFGRVLGAGDIGIALRQRDVVADGPDFVRPDHDAVCPALEVILVSFLEIGKRAARIDLDALLRIERGDTCGIVLANAFLVGRPDFFKLLLHVLRHGRDS